MGSVNENQALIIKALAHPTRIEILELLREGEKCVCELSPALGLEQSNVSQHLAILRKYGIINCRKEGLKVMYSVKNKRVFEIIASVNAILLDQLKETETILKTLKGTRT